MTTPNAKKTIDDNFAYRQEFKYTHDNPYHDKLAGFDHFVLRDEEAETNVGRWNEHIFKNELPVEIEIANTQSNELKAGMYGTAVFAANQKKESLKIVPRNAFVGSVSSNEVFVVENNIAKFKKVTAGRILGDKVEILDGLNDGDIVVVTGQINLQDGNTVEIIK